MSDPPSSESPQLQLVNEFSRGFVEGDVNHLAKYLHRDFRRTVYPRSLGVQEYAREEWLKDMAEVIAFATTLDTINHSVIEAPGTVIIHATTHVKTSSGVELDRESIYITHIVVDDDGSLKILRFDEFTDSQGYLNLYQAAAGAKAM